MACRARLIIHRYATPGLLDEQGYPLRERGVLATPASPRASGTAAPMTGMPGPECGNATVIHEDGCDFCIACGYTGQRG